MEATPEPFGQRIDANGERVVGNPGGPVTRGYTGHEHDDELGLINMRGRLYDPRLRRFLTTDPMVAHPLSQGWNPYSYVLNNPLRLVDPLGMQPDSGRVETVIYNRGESETSGVPTYDMSTIYGDPQGQDESADKDGEEAPIVKVLLGTIILGEPDEIEQDPPPDQQQQVTGVDFIGGSSAETTSTPPTLTSRGGSPASSATVNSGTCSNPAGVGCAKVDYGSLGVLSDPDFHVEDTSPSLMKWYMATQLFTGAAELGTALSVLRGGGLLSLADDAARGVTAARGAWRYVCFAKGTKVHTPTGLKAIEDVEVGDLVWSRDDETGEVAVRRVARTFVTPDKALLQIVVESGDGEIEALKVTGEHPVWVRETGWTRASELVPGDEVARFAGGWLRVASVDDLRVHETVYNVEVEEFHTYFVGEVGVWVHNTCWDDIAAHVVRDHPTRFPGRSAEQLAGYIRTFAETGTPTTTANGAKIWRRGAEILIQRPAGSGNPGTLMKADSVKAAGRYLQRFIQDNGGAAF